MGLLDKIFGKNESEQVIDGGIIVQVDESYDEFLQLIDKCDRQVTLKELEKEFEIGFTNHNQKKYK